MNDGRYFSESHLTKPRGLAAFALQHHSRQNDGQAKSLLWQSPTKQSIIEVERLQKPPLIGRFEIAQTPILQNVLPPDAQATESTPLIYNARHATSQDIPIALDACQGCSRRAVQTWRHHQQWMGHLSNARGTYREWTQSPLTNLNGHQFNSMVEYLKIPNPLCHLTWRNTHQNPWQIRLWAKNLSTFYWRRMQTGDSACHTAKIWSSNRSGDIIISKYVIHTKHKFLILHLQRNEPFNQYIHHPISRAVWSPTVHTTHRNLMHFCSSTMRQMRHLQIESTTNGER